MEPVYNQVTEMLFSRRQQARVAHTAHIANEEYQLETCEFCRTEYHMLLPPLDAD